MLPYSHYLTLAFLFAPLPPPHQGFELHDISLICVTNPALIIRSMLCTPFSSYVVLDQVPYAQQPSHVHKLNDDPRTAPSASLSCQQPLTFQLADNASSPLYVGGGLPPVPAKLAKRIQDGQFIKMGELLPEVLRRLTPYDDNHQKSSKSKIRELDSIVD